MTRAVFLDRDGTINVDSGYIKYPKHFKFIRGARAALKLLNKKVFYFLLSQISRALDADIIQ